MLKDGSEKLKDYSMSYFQSIYLQIGNCGVAIVLLGVFALYLCIVNLLFTQLSWHTFKKEFLDLKGIKRCLINYQGHNPFLKIIYEIVKTHASHSDDVRAEVSYLFNRHFQKTINGMSWLKMITVISPLLGLLGTVTGMLKVFDSLKEQSIQSQALLAQGISQALVSTVLGLIVAVPCMVIYYYLSLRMKNFYIEAIEHSYKAIKVHQTVNE